LPAAIVPKVGHGPDMGQNGFDRACVSVVFLFLLCFIAHSYEANGGWTFFRFQSEKKSVVNGFKPFERINTTMKALIFGEL